MTNSGVVSNQWASRPSDERFLSLDELHNSVLARTRVSKVFNSDTKTLRAHGTKEGELLLSTEEGVMFLSNWSFGQLASAAKAPGGYLKTLTAELASDCLNYGLERSAREEQMLMVDKGADRLRCLTSTTYGRIWDKEVVEAVKRVNSDGRWKIPAASYATADPKRATTLYASDRDVFIFLVDDQHPIEIDGETLFRGFYTWNSEVGSAVFGLRTFLYRYVCDNRIIWGMQDVKELRIRHTIGAPERFVQEGRRALVHYAEAETRSITERIKRAKSIQIGKDEESVNEFLQKYGLTLAQSQRVVETAKAEGENPRTAWGIAQGITAAARSIQNQDMRVKQEAVAGKLLSAVVS